MLKPLRLLWPPVLIGAIRSSFRQVRNSGGLDPEEAEKAIRGLETPETVGTPAQRWRELRAPPSVIEAGFLLAAYVVKLQEVWDELPTVPEPTVAGDPPSEP